MNCEFMIASTPLPPCMPLPKAMLRLPVSNTAKVMYARLLDEILTTRGTEDSNGILFIRFPVMEILDAVIRIQGIVRLVVAGPLGIGRLIADTGPERLGHIVRNFHIFILGVPVVKIAQVDDSHCMYLHIVFVVGLPGNDMEGGGERHPGEPFLTLGLFVSKWSRQETTTPAQRCTVRVHEMTQLFMYLQISRLWSELSGGGAILFLTS